MSAQSKSTQPGRAERSNRPLADPRWYFPGYGFVARVSRPSRSTPRQQQTEWTGTARAGHVPCDFCDLSFQIKDRWGHEHVRHRRPGENYIDEREMCNNCGQAWWTIRGAGGGKALDTQEMHSLYLCPARIGCDSWVRSGHETPRWVRKSNSPDLAESAIRFTHENRELRPRPPLPTPSNPDLNFNDPLPPPATDPAQSYFGPSDLDRLQYGFDDNVHHNLPTSAFAPRSRNQPPFDAYSSTLQAPYLIPLQQHYLPYTALPSQQPLPQTFNPNLPLLFPSHNNSLDTYSGNLYGPPAQSPQSISYQYPPSYQVQYPPMEENPHLRRRYSLGKQQLRRSHLLTLRQALRYGNLLLQIPPSYCRP